MRPDRSFLGVIYRLSDAACIVLALVLSSLISPYPWYESQWQMLYLFASACAIGLYFLVAEYQGLYLAARGTTIGHELRQIVWTWLIVLSGLLLLAYAIKVSADYPRRVMLIWFALVPVIIFSWRVLLNIVLKLVRSRDQRQKRVAIYGFGEAAQSLAKNIHVAPWMELKLVGFYADGFGQTTIAVDKGVSADILGGMSQLIDDVKDGQLDVVYVALPSGSEDQTEALINQLADTAVSVYVVPNLFLSDLLHARWLSLNGTPVISVFETPFYGIDGSIKRIVDVVFGAIILAMIAIPMLIIAVAIRMTSPGPIIFKQKRYGLDGREIVVWKFRTMTVCEQGEDFVQAVKNDPRVTSIGNFLRRHSLDELPQFINVLQGTMSIVGPRPHPVALNEQHRQFIKGYMLRHRVKPGITGLAQVNGWRGETDTLEKMEKRVEFDLAYIRNWSLTLDLKIIFKTIFSGFRGENAY